jgi:hypothetical protein
MEKILEKLFEKMEKDPAGFFLSTVWVMMLTASMVKTAIDNFQYNIAYFANIKLIFIAQNSIVVVMVICAYASLAKIHPLFGWGLASLLKTKNKGNILVMPMNIKYFGIIFGGVLLLNLPKYAMMEEEMFRQGTNGWAEALAMSVVFGLVHCLVGVPVGVGLALSVAGTWFNYQYFQGGVELSAQHHFTYNLIIFGLAFVFIIWKHLKKGGETTTKIK